jgi:hypothetical protein
MELVLIALIIIAISIVTYLVYKRLQPKEKNELAKTVNIVTFFVTAISLVGAAYTYYDNIKRQNAVLAYGIYQEVIKMNMDDKYIEFLASGKFPKYKEQDIQNLSEEDKKMYEKYQWFVGSNLFQFESIIALDDPGWEKTIEGFIGTHTNYISNKSGVYKFPCLRYSDEIQQFVKNVTQRDCSLEKSKK